ncbi:MAG: hypothetical protein DCC65_12800 [Planctomycetota bacterium]|nr:MAG: hypothetical protein DCC65_12800 [Planctomycetota bacterium]
MQCHPHDSCSSGKSFSQRLALTFRAAAMCGTHARATQVIVTIFSLAASAAGDARGPEVFRLAGSFNNWAAGDDAYTLRPRGEGLELVRFWECGTYEFKFTCNGSWDRHYGSAGGDRLAQPGGNIRLNIPRSATYAIRLDTSNMTWTLRRVRPDRAVAHFRVLGGDIGSASVILDGRMSEAPEGGRITNYNWTFASKDGRAEFALEGGGELPAGMRRVNILRPGIFTLRLEVSDGKTTSAATRTVRLGEGWTLTARVEAGSGATRDEVIDLRPLADGAWGAVLGGGPFAKLSAQANPALPLKRIAPISSTFEHSDASQVFVRVMPSTRAMAFHTEGFHEFSYRPASDAPGGEPVERVDIVGDFNGWSPGATPMHEVWEGASRFVRILELPEGVYRYKLTVNGARWIEDPAADSSLRTPDDSGGFNSGFRVGPDAEAFGPARPDAIACGAARHDPASATYFSPIDDDLVRLTVRTLKDDVEGVAADIETVDGDLPLSKTDSRGGFDYWSATCRIKPPVVTYCFTLTDGAARSRLDSHQCRHLPSAGGESFSVQTAPFETEVRMSFKTPDWAKRVVWYQIFPERFRNGTEANDPPRTVPWRHAWDKPYDGSRAKDPKRRFKEQGSFFHYIYDRRYGGDLQGIRDKLPYLRDLGITAIYLNPVFHAESLHKYDASDYRHIDDSFGVAGSIKKLKDETADPATWQWSESDRVFLDFLQEAHRLGFKVIIDGVFNHVGRDFWAFQDVLKQGRKSRFADWFDITSWEPFHYRAWDRDDGSLPRLKHDDALGLCEPVRAHLFAVTRRWMDPNGDGDPSDGIDGWRLDVASDINANFWRDWRKVVKSINPDAYIVAELWEESRAWLDGQTFDAVMNYPFARASQRFFVNRQKKIGPSAFDRQLREVLSWYAPQVSYVLQNLFDSHDTDRVASMFMNPDLEYDQANRPQDNGPHYNTAKPTRECYERLKLMVTHQMTHLGAPMIYYGDEVGMFGADDPSCRKPMLWPELLPYDDPNEKIETDVLDHYRRMIAIRNTYPAIQLGSLDTLLTDDHKGVYAFARSLDGQSVVVVLNNSSHSHRLDVTSPWPDGTTIVRLDDPNEAEIVDPSPEDPASRPFIKAKNLHHPHIRVEGGHLRGMMLHPYGCAVLARIGR